MYGAIGCSLNGSTSNTVEVPNAYSVAGFTGITFFAKGTPSSLQVIVNTTETTSTMYGGTCTSTTCIGNRALISLSSSTWAQYMVPFSTLTGGMSGSTTATFNAAHALTINFQAQNSSAVGSISADFWIDDLSFY